MGCGCKDASSNNSCKGRPDCSLRLDHPERKASPPPAQESLLPPTVILPHPPRHWGYLAPKGEVPAYTLEQMLEYGRACVAEFIKHNPQ